MEIRFSPRAARELRTLQAKTASRIADRLEELAADPAGPHLDVKPLVGRRPWRRLRVGQHRILFRAMTGDVLLVGRIVDRRDLERAVRSLTD